MSAVLLGPNDPPQKVKVLPPLVISPFGAHARPPALAGSGSC
jgi:hypothetical protein